MGLVRGAAAPAAAVSPALLNFSFEESSENTSRPPPTGLGPIRPPRHISPRFPSFYYVPCVLLTRAGVPLGRSNAQARGQAIPGRAAALLPTPPPHPPYPTPDTSTRTCLPLNLSPHTQIISIIVCVHGAGHPPFQVVWAGSSLLGWCRAFRTLRLTSLKPPSGWVLTPVT